MTDSRRDFLVRFATAALTLAGAGCESAVETIDRPQERVLYGPGPYNPDGIRDGSIEDFLRNVGDRVFFATDRYDLTAEAKAALDRQIAWLRRYSDHTVRIEGHCDERGTREYNLGLGNHRANTVKRYMVAAGIAPQRLEIVSFGKERPAVMGANQEAWAKNRRAVAVLTK